MKKVCFVCLGNICRSPMAEFVMKDVAKDAGLHIESRGTSDWEHGNPIHRGTLGIFRKHEISYDRSKVSQQVTRQDLQDFDYIIGMDENNVRDLRRLSGSKYDEKIFLFTSGGVPDPWYTGDFEATYDLVKTGCQHWLERIID